MMEQRLFIDGFRGVSSVYTIHKPLLVDHLPCPALARSGPFLWVALLVAFERDSTSIWWKPYMA